jgi:hypothetical protein
VIITGDGTDIPFNVTDKSNTVPWLSVSKDGQVVMKGGNVGVGTQSVSAKLQVSGSSLLSNGTGDSWFPYTDGDSYVSGTNVMFRSDGNNERMRITKGGDIGIGTTAPNAKLDVNGTVAAGGLTVGSQGITVANGGMIQGRLWGKEFSLDGRANSNSKLSMTKVATSVCFLTGLYGSLVGRGEMAKIRNAGERWELDVKQGNQAGLEATAMCIGSPE